MKPMSMISVIVPIYRTEKYLDQCIQSIVQQTYKNLEILLIDDGSPDRCPQICDKWVKLDSRIRVIHQINGGGGKARNTALDMAKGRYISFVDSDDYVAPQMFEILLSYFDEDIDIVECEYCKVKEDFAGFHIDYPNCKMKRYATVDAMRENISGSLFEQIIWNKIYRKSVIGEIRFPEGKMIDDEFWTYKVIGNARNLVHIDDRLYAYRQQDLSVMHTAFSLQRLQAIEAKKEKIEYIIHNFNELTFEAYKNMWYTCLYLGQLSLIYLDGPDCRKAFSLMKETLKEFRFSKEDARRLELENRFWWYLTKMSVKITCKFRNLLKIGY